MAISAAQSYFNYSKHSSITIVAYLVIDYRTVFAAQAQFGEELQSISPSAAGSHSVKVSRPHIPPHSTVSVKRPVDDSSFL